MKPSKPITSREYSPRAPLIALGVKIQQLDLLKPVRESVTIRQKTLRHSPDEKLLDALITILAGAHGMYELNTRVRADPALQKAFGRQGCADQSVVQATLNAATSTNVAQLMQAINHIFQQHSLAAQHDFRALMLLLDIDLTGLPCGKTYEYATKGYQGEAGIRWGRQMVCLSTRTGPLVLIKIGPDTLDFKAAVSCGSRLCAGSGSFRHRSR